MDQIHPPTQKPKHTASQEDHDSPWKGALEVFFQPFMDFLYPHIADLINWQQPVEFLDKELQKSPARLKTHGGMRTSWSKYIF